MKDKPPMGNNWISNLTETHNFLKEELTSRFNT